MSYARVNGVQLYYELHGPEDAEVMVLSNGVLMSTASWGYQTVELAKHFRVLLYDCRGMWQSEHPEDAYSMEQHADDLACLLDELQIQKAHIAGISYGSEVSMMFALMYPERTQSLIVADGVSQIDPLLKAMGDCWVSAAELKNAQLLMETTKPLNFSEEYLIKNEEILNNLVLKYEQLDFESFIRLMESFYNFDVTHRLKEISAPTLVMVGEKDILKTRSYSDRIAAEIPNAEFVLIPGAGHAACLEKPNVFNTLLIGFAKKNKGIN
jgi:3-oxoadipate enol-lactonase